jgi:hypothetical protein
VAKYFGKLAPARDQRVESSNGKPVRVYDIYIPEGAEVVQMEQAKAERQRA